MKPDSTRYIVLKINVNEAESLAIRQNCAGRSISAAGRELLLNLRPQAHRIRRAPRREGARLGPVCEFPSRRVSAPVPLRL
jgi:hypothetical protein